MATSSASQKQPAFMLEMMERLGINPGTRVAAQWNLSYMTALHRCRDCNHTRQCRTWLDDTVSTTALPPRFCSNADIFFEMQVDQPGPHAGDLSTVWMH